MGILFGLFCVILKSREEWEDEMISSREPPEEVLSSASVDTAGKNAMGNVKLA